MPKQFEGQHEDEQVLFIFRHHIIKMRKGFYLLAIPFLIGSIPILVWPDNTDNLWYAIAGLFLGVLLFFYHWLSWYFSIFIVTDQRLRQITQKGFFNRSVIDLGLSKIQNISYNVPGFSASIFGFGTLVVQTYVGDLYLEKIEHPTKIYNELTAVIKQYAGTESAMINNQ
jgi:signal transduction histidine kinase